MTATAFRRIALGLEGAIESAHMGHPDFRVNGRIFATLQTADRGMVKLTPDQQGQFINEYPGVFVAESGAWGRQGCTRVYLESADSESVGEALTLAWQQTRAIVRKPSKRRNRN